MHLVRNPPEASMPEAIMTARVLAHADFLMLVRGWRWEQTTGIVSTYTVRLKGNSPERGDWCSDVYDNPWAACGQADAELALREALGGRG